MRGRSAVLLFGSCALGLAIAAPSPAWAQAATPPVSAPADGAKKSDDKPASPAASAPAGGLAIVDVQRAIASCTAGQAAKKKLDELTQTKQKPLQEKQTELQKRMEAYDQQKSKLSDEIAQQQELELTGTKNNLQRDFDEAREDIQAQQQKLLSPLLAKVETQLKALAKEKGYSLILESSNPGVLYHADSIDITDQVIERLNREK